jgi:hypothetical protein
MRSRRRKFFFRRHPDSSLIVGRIIDQRAGLHALSMDPFVPCVTHWNTISITPRFSSSTTCRKMNDLLRDAIATLQTCFSGSDNTQEQLLRVKTIYIIPNEENQDKITSVQVYTGRFKSYQTHWEGASNKTSIR